MENSSFLGENETKIVSNLIFYNESHLNEIQNLKIEAYFVPILFSAIFLVGTIGNGSLIYIVVKNKHMRTIPNIYIMNLSIGDLMLIIICIPFTATIYTAKNWPYGEVMCKLTEFLQNVSVGVSVFTLTALSADRFFAVVLSMKRLRGNVTKYTILVVVAIWIVALLLSIPDACFSSVLSRHNTSYCHPHPDYLGIEYSKSHVMCKFIIYYAIPLVIISIFYSLMARNLLISSKNLPTENKGQVKQVEGRRKVAKMVLSMVIIFMICFLPKHTFALWFYFNPHAFNEYNNVWHAVRILGFCLAFINSCINPIALYFLSKVFRQQFNRYLFCYCAPCKSANETNLSHETNPSLTYYNSTVRRTSTTMTMVHFVSV